jgi:NMD protein affecting ribosome stability and mRNA decay
MSNKKGGPVRTRRNVQQYGDPYLPKLNPGEIAVCKDCHAIFQRRHWFFNENLYRTLMSKRGARETTCPACQKIRDGYFEGEVTLMPSTFLSEHKEEIMNLIRNEEERAKGMNPLERIIAVKEENGKVVVLTTDEKLSQRIGRELKKAYQGKTVYRWSEDTKCARVTWSRE